MYLKVVNPVETRRKSKRKKTRKKKNNKLFKSKRKGITTLARTKRKRTRTRKAAAKTRRRKTNNPARIKYRTKTVYHNRRRGRRRKHRNPVLFDGGSTTDMIMKSGAAAVGGVSAPWITSVFGISGNMKYLAQIGIAFVGSFILKQVGAGKYATPFAYGVLAVTGYQFASDKGLLMGYFTNQDYSNIYDMNRLSSVPIQETAMVSGAAGTGGSVPLMGAEMLNMETEN